MIFKICFAFLVGVAVTSSMPAIAYELGTHARLTQMAITSSILNSAKFADSLGIDSNSLSPFGNEYYDLHGGTTITRTRETNVFESQFIPLQRDQLLTLPAWLMRGAIREDDYTFGPNPWFLDPDLPYSIVRVKNHFFDPRHKRGLNAPLVSGEMAPQWAVGSTDIFSQPNQPNTSRLNHYTVFDARKACMAALQNAGDCYA